MCRLPRSCIEFIVTLYRELKMVGTDAGILLIMLFAPMIYTLIYSTAYGSEVVDSVPIGVVDEDNTSRSRHLVRSIATGDAVSVVAKPVSMAEARRLFYEDDIFGIVYIPSGYEHALIAGKQADVGLVVDGSHLLLYKRIVEHIVTVASTIGAQVVASDIVAHGGSITSARNMVMPIQLDVANVYNPQLGYATFVMPSIFIVIIQQTLLIGIGMVAVRRASNIRRGRVSLGRAVRVVTARLCAYLLIYAVVSVSVLGLLWHLYDLPFEGRVVDVVLLLAIYVVASASMALALSCLFVRREAPLMSLLWSSVPILLLAGISYPREAFAAWLYNLGRLFPSSSAVDAFVRLNTMGAPFRDITSEVMTLVILAFVYLLLAIFVERHGGFLKKKMIR